MPPPPHGGGGGKPGHGGAPKRKVFEGETVTSLMAASVLSDGQSIWLSAPLPVGMDVEGAQITRSYLGESFSVELPAEKIFHGLRVARGQ